MGAHPHIDHKNFPKQGSLINRAVSVCFHYNTEHRVNGVCIRDDIQEPFITIFLLEDKRVVLATECQYQYDPAPAPEKPDRLRHYSTPETVAYDPNHTGHPPLPIR